MAGKDIRAAGNEYVKNLAALFPEDQREAALKILSGVSEQVGQDLLKQTEFNRLADEVRADKAENLAYKERLNRWWNNKHALADAAAALLKSKGMDPDKVLESEPEADSLARMIAAEGNGDGKGNGTPVDTSNFVPRSELDAIKSHATQEIARATGLVVPFISHVMKLSDQHREEFKKSLDVAALIDFCNKNGIPIDKGGYEAFVKEEREKHSADALKVKLEEAERRGFERGRTEATKLPFPGVGSDDEGDPSYPAPSALTGLTLKPREDKAVDATIAEAVKVFHEERVKNLGR